MAAEHGGGDLKRGKVKWNAVFAVLLLVCVLSGSAVKHVHAECTKNGPNPYCETYYHPTYQRQVYNCTWYAWQKVYEVFGIAMPGFQGNAGGWANEARKAGYQVDMNIAPHTVAVWNRGGTDGHVAFVESVNGNTVTVTEAGSYYGKCATNHLSISDMSYRSGNGTLVGYIHFAQSWPPSDGSFIRYGNHIFCLAGGAPLYVSSWESVGGVQSFTDASEEQFRGLLSVPKNDTYIRGFTTGRIFRVVEGHPYYLDGTAYEQLGRPASINVSDYAIDNGDHLNCDPRGASDGIVGEKGCVRVGGWVWDGDRPSESVQVQIWIGGPSGAAGAESFTISANTPREDIAQSYIGIGENHGYAANIRTGKRGSQPVYVYALNLEGTAGNNLLLAQKTVTIGDCDPEGTLDECIGGKGTVRVRGCAFDWDNVSAGTKVRMYIGDPSLAGSEVHELGAADKYRPDLEQTYHGAGDHHGYDVTVETAKRGLQEIYVYAINESGTGGSDKLLGRSAVTIAEADAEHRYTAVVTDATCTRRGYTTYSCSHCGDSYVADYTEAFGHIWGQWAVTKEASENEDGEKERSCRLCQEKEVQVIEALQHVHHYSTSLVTEPTCTEGGYTISICDKCHDEYIGNYTQPTGHTWGEWVITKEPTDDAEGIKVNTCKECGVTETGRIPNLKHSHRYSEYFVSAPTCEEQGYTAYICNDDDCGNYFLAEYKPALGHHWENWVITKEATETENGRKERSCSVCGKKETAVIKKKVFQQYHVYFETGCEAIVSSIPGLGAGSKINSPTPPERNGYLFQGWYKEKACINAWNFRTDLVKNNLTLYAKWKAKTIKLRFKSEKKTKTVKNIYGKPIKLAKTPKRKGYKFKGWYTKKKGGKKVTKKTKVPWKKTTYYARWVKKS